MTGTLLLVFVVLIVACASALALRSTDVPAPQRQATHPRHLVISASYAQACFWAAEAGLPASDWQYVHTTPQLRGLQPEDIVIHLWGEYARSPIWEEPEAITMLRYLGLNVFDPFETVPDGILPA